MTNDKYSENFKNDPTTSQSNYLPSETENLGTTRIDKAAILSSNDELEKALLTMPIARAPKRNLTNIMARIATLPQFDVDAAALSIGLVPPRKIKYTPPVFENTSVVAKIEETPTVPIADRSGHFNPIGYMFIGLWLTICIFTLYLIWPGISSLILGPPHDPDGLARLQALQNWWQTVTSNLVAFITLIGPVLPTIISASAGFIILMYLINQQHRRLWLD